MRNNLDFYTVKERIFLVKTFYKNDSDAKCVKSKYLLEYGATIDGPTEELIFEVINLFEETGSVREIPEQKVSLDDPFGDSGLLCEIKVEAPEIKTEDVDYTQDSHGVDDNVFHTEDSEHKRVQKEKTSTMRRNRVRIKGGGGEFACDICKQTSKTIRGIRIHMARHATERLSCKYCQETFPSKFQLKRHRAEMHKKAPKVKAPVQCPLCPKTFREANNMRKHLPVHSDKKDAVCEVCGNAYKSKHTLRIHMRLHTGEEPFKCDYQGCGRTFRSQGSFIIHKRSHTDERPYPCPHCGKGFKDRGNLRAHIRVHTGENPYKCELCGKETKQKQNLQSHMIHYHKIYGSK
ncbi:zinc finger protein 836-like [Phlebotomus argentipes]|uniref:zinc finger protein 836-like n=1 Tax=Phlebotomus argentipes TaxID=94469 RepID=UPI0028933319|nr:zinc finger protein 836-like [Phlebotomus argentipes]